MKTATIITPVPLVLVLVASLALPLTVVAQTQSAAEHVVALKASLGASHRDTVTQPW